MRSTVDGVRHGYTNETTLTGGEVIKSYRGPDAASRALAERRALAALAGVFPVPAVLAGGPTSLTLGFVPGRHGQDLLAAGAAAAVLRACGGVLRRLHAIPVDTVWPGATGVVVHGDFGPNNVLFSAGSLSVAAVLDWEFCHPGEPIEDLAWCEWIVRMHHPGAVEALSELFGAYGQRPSWTRRRSVMVERCHWFERFCRTWDPDGGGVALWSDRAARTAAWQE
jgi:aminoglycoside phosphotransferase